MKAAESALAKAGVARRLQADNRGKAELLGPIHDSRLVDQFRLTFPHDIPDVSVDAAALRQSGRHCPHDVPVSVGEKECAEELSGRRVAKRQKIAGDQKARRAVGIGKCVNGAANVVKGLSFAPLADDYVGLIKRLMPVERNSEKLELVFMLHIGIVADPRRVELPGKQQRRNLLIGPSLYELDGSPEPLGKVRLQQREQLNVGIEKQRIEADADGLSRARRCRRPKEGRRGEAGEDVPSADRNVLLAAESGDSRGIAPPSAPFVCRRRHLRRPPSDASQNNTDGRDLLQQNDPLDILYAI